MRRYKFTISGNKYNVEIKSLEENIAEVEVNGTSYQVGLGKEIKTPQTPKLVRYNPPAPPKTPVLSSTGMSSIRAPLPGTIIAISVLPGMQIKLDQPVIILEAMKMEQEIKAATGGTVSDILVNAGDTVKKEQALILIG